MVGLHVPLVHLTLNIQHHAKANTAGQTEPPSFLPHHTRRFIKRHTSPLLPARPACHDFVIVSRSDNVILHVTLQH